MQRKRRFDKAFQVETQQKQNLGKIPVIAGESCSENPGGPLSRWFGAEMLGLAGRQGKLTTRLMSSCSILRPAHVRI